MTAEPRPGFILGIHPTSERVGWVVFEGPFSPHDWGNIASRGIEKNTRCLKRIEKLFDRFEPDAVVLEAFEKSHSARADRIARLGRAIVALAQSRSIEAAVFTRGEVKSCFASVGAVSRQEVAEAVARVIPAFAHLLPTPRRPWQHEPGRMGLFTAAALILTYYQHTASRFLDDLREESLDWDEFGED